MILDERVGAHRAAPLCEREDRCRGGRRQKQEVDEMHDERASVSARPVDHGKRRALIEESEERCADECEHDAHRVRACKQG